MQQTLCRVEVRVEVLGPLRVVRRPAGGGEEVVERFYSPKAAALLAYLALGLGRAHGRELLLELFWPDLDPAAGRDNLSTLLSALRRHLEPAGTEKGAVLAADRQTVSLNPAAVATDAAEWERLTRDASRAPDPASRAALLGRAAALYRGEPLPGVYEEWAVREQAVWPERHAATLERWAAALDESGEREAALTACERAIAADPLREECHRRRMRLLALLGRPGAAREAYAALERLLRDELGAGPAAETRRLAQTIKEGALSSAPAPPSTAAPAAVPSPPPPLASDVPAARAGSTAPPLPQPLTRLYGRDAEAARVAALLADPDGPRLVTVLGAGGSGKTRLAVEVARRAVSDSEVPFGGRVYFVPLADLPVAGLVPSSVVRALGLPPGGQGEGGPMDRAVEALSSGDGPALLVLDNLEHLLGGGIGAAGDGKGDAAAGGVPGGAAAYVRLLLERVPGLRVLATSRRVLGLGGEQAFPLAPLAAPDPSDDADPAAVLASPAVALFADRARAAKPDFAVTAANAAAVADICRRLEGMPLAIEIAAAWSRALPPARLRERLEEGLIDLASRRRDLPERHRTLRAAVEWSYRLLEPGLQALFRRLSVFRGGWTLEAAEAFAGDDGTDVLDGLAELQDRSLVLEHAAPEGGAGEAGEPRWRMLEPLREFGAHALAEAGEAGRWADLHAARFADLAWEAGPHLDGARQTEWLDRLEADYDNLRAALDLLLDRSRTVEQQEVGLKTCSALYRFWQYRGASREGLMWCDRALRETAALPPTSARASVANATGNLWLDRGDYDRARACYQEAYDAWVAVNGPTGPGVALGGLALVAKFLGDHAAARDLNERAAAVFRANNAENNLAVTLGNLAANRKALGEKMTELLPLYEEVIAIRRRTGNRAGLALALNNFARALHDAGDTAAARVHVAEAVAINEEMGNAAYLAHTHYTLGEFAADAGDLPAARAYHAAALRAWHGAGTVADAANAVEGLARVAAAAGDHGRAAQLFGALDTARAAMPRAAEQVRPFEEAAEAARATLGGPRFDALRGAGRALPWDDAVALALEGVPLDPSPTTPPV